MFARYQVCRTASPWGASSWKCAGTSLSPALANCWRHPANEHAGPRSGRESGAVNTNHRPTLEVGPARSMAPLLSVPLLSCCRKRPRRFRSDQTAVHSATPRGIGCALSAHSHASFRRFDSWYSRLPSFDKGRPWLLRPSQRTGGRASVSVWWGERTRVIDWLEAANVVHGGGPTHPAPTRWLSCSEARRVNYRNN